MEIEVYKMISGLERGTKQIVTVWPRAGSMDYSMEQARVRFKRNRGRQLFTELLAKGYGEHKAISLSLSLDFRAISLR